MKKAQVNGESVWAHRVEVMYDQISRLEYASALMDASGPGRNDEPQPIMRSRNGHIARSEMDFPALVMFARPLFDRTMKRGGSVYYKNVIPEAISHALNSGVPEAYSYAMALANFETKCDAFWDAPAERWISSRTNWNVWDDIVYAYYFHEDKQFKNSYKERLVKPSFVPQLTERYMDGFALVAVLGELVALSKEMADLFEEIFEIV